MLVRGGIVCGIYVSVLSSQFSCKFKTVLELKNNISFFYELMACLGPVTHTFILNLFSPM